MRSQKNKVKNSAGASSSRTQSTKKSDVDSRLLQQLSSKMGNSGLSSTLQKAAQDRDTLLQYIGSRLRNIQHIQHIELDEVDLRPEWFRNVAKGEHGYFLPDPTRWKEVAQTYKQAGQALCRGDVSRGKQLLERALEQEQAVQESLPIQITERLDNNETSEPSSPTSTASEGNEVCAARNPTSELAIADQIISVRSTVKNAQPVRRPGSLQWWEQQEESEEEESKDNETEQHEHDAEQEDMDLEHEHSDIDKDEL